jgi:hypothetical protein
VLGADDLRHYAVPHDLPITPVPEGDNPPNLHVATIVPHASGTITAILAGSNGAERTWPVLNGQAFSVRIVKITACDFAFTILFSGEGPI